MAPVIGRIVMPYLMLVLAAAGLTLVWRARTRASQVSETADALSRRE